ncbi:hypothetical protein [Ruania zhangjianzhongii]|uniref:hypothetical protein n=1 Tax=Ruania zhangjianzhongii TaxID=2603206 RepID=UPI0011C8003A|nr:hypothetical protein [Ruania zhangjianzhongii]
MTLEGMEEVSLAAGYRWNALTGEVGAPVITYREGKENVVWAVEVEGRGQGTTAIHYTPIQPVLPDIDLATDLSDDERGSK